MRRGQGLLRGLVVLGTAEEHNLFFVSKEGKEEKEGKQFFILSSLTPRRQKKQKKYDDEEKKLERENDEYSRAAPACGWRSGPSRGTAARRCPATRPVSLFCSGEGREREREERKERV